MNFGAYKLFEASGPGLKTLASFSLKIRGTFDALLAFFLFN